MLAVSLFLLQVIPYLSYRWVTDESWYAAPAYSLVHGDGIRDPEIGPNDLENRLDVRPPGTALVIASFFKLFGVGQITARLGSVTAGLFILLLVYWITRDYFGNAAAVSACLLAATDNLIVLVSRAARPEALTAMSMLLSLAALCRYHRQRQWLWSALSGLLIAAATMFHITVLGYIVSFAILVVAIDIGAGKRWFRGLTGFAFGFILGMLPFAVCILSVPLGRQAFHQEYLSRALGESLATKLAHEMHRYIDLFGIGMIHGHGLQWLPVRLPIPLFLAVCTYVLYRFGRRWFYVEMVLLLPTLVWFVDTANKSSRYLAVVAPVFCMLVGAAIDVTQTRVRLHRAIVWLAVAVVIAQAGANIFLLSSARHANYTKLADELRAAVPPGQTVYGTITFWLAFKDQPFISYERTGPWMAANQYHARYFIVGDRMYTLGNPWDSAFNQDLHRQLDEVASRSELVTEISDPYYGELKVYRLLQPGR